MHELDIKAKKAENKSASLGKDLDLEKYNSQEQQHVYVDNPLQLEKKETERFLKVGVDASEDAGTFIQKDNSLVHCKSRQKDIEIMSISSAREKYDWLKKYMWNAVDVDTDKYTARVHLKKHEGYFIRSLPGAVTKRPVQSCLYIANDNIAQNAHNLVIAEENSELKIITGCVTASHLNKGLHLGVSEFYVKKGATLTFTMVHDWGEKVDVRPRTVVYVEEGGTFVSNYICLKPAGSLQMYPKVYLNGKGAVARNNSILVSKEGSHLDIGSKIYLNAEETKAEIISRAITLGGSIIARGALIGKVPGVKAHLECKGLILGDGLMHAIPEIEAHVPGVEMSHEAAVGKINQEEIEYLMARGLDEEQAVSTIVRGFLNVDVEGLPKALQEQLDKTISETEKDMF